jgi:hypothetical protein
VIANLPVIGGSAGLGLDPGVGAIDRSRPVRTPDPDEDYVASGPLASGLDGYEREVGLYGSLRWHGVREYEAMANTPAPWSCVNTIRAGVLSGGMGLLPAIKDSTERAMPGQRDGSAVDAAMARQIMESNRRTLEAWHVPYTDVAWEMMEALWLGHVMAEVEAERVEGGPDAGNWALTGLRPLHRDNYRFLVDEAGRVGAVGAVGLDGRWGQFDTSHFAWLTWDAYRGDPRGRSCFRMAHYHWRMLMDLWPEIYKGWRQFGVPMMWGTTAPNAMPEPEAGSDGQPKPGGRVLSAARAMAVRMMQMLNGARAAGPNGSDIKVIESTKDSSVVSGAVTILEAQIKQSIILAIRATTEAQHGSKADSGTAQDVLGTLIKFIRRWVERFFRQLLIRQNTWNYGSDIARRLTPLVDLGATEHQDFAQIGAIVAQLHQASFWSPSQFVALDNWIGAPPRQPGEGRVGPNGPVPDTIPMPTAPAPDAAPAKEAA